MKKSGKLACHTASSNIAIDSLPTLQISVVNIALFGKIYDGEPILIVISNIGEDDCTLYITVVSIKCMMWEVCRSPTLCRYWETIVDFKWHKHGSLSRLFTTKKRQKPVFFLVIQTGSCDLIVQTSVADPWNFCVDPDPRIHATDSFENLNENSLKGDQRMIPNSTHLFSHWSISLKSSSHWFSYPRELFMRA